MEEYKIGNAKVRMHGEPNIDQIKEATEKFIRKVLNEERKIGKNIINTKK